MPSHPLHHHHRPYAINHHRPYAIYHHQQAQAALLGHATPSTEDTRSPFSTNLSTAVRIVSPVSTGTLRNVESQNLSNQVYMCPEQEMAQTEFLLSWLNRLKKFNRGFLLFSMLALSDEEHSLRVLPVVPSVKQAISVPLQINQESYCELINKSRTISEVHAYSRERHLYSSPALKRLQVFNGVFSSTFDTLQRIWVCVSNLKSPETVGKFRKTLESATTDKPIGLVSKPLVQVDHSQAADPPADEPVSKTFSAEGRSQLRVSHFRCDRVISDPRKYSSASLYRQACLVPLEWQAPSQQLMTTLVHEANLLVAGSVERYPWPQQVSGRFLLDPKSVLLRLQQLSSTSDKLLPMQQPPPMKQIRNLFFSVPWWKQRAGDEPSRHLALASVLWMTFLQSQAFWARLKTSNSTAILIKILLINRLQTSPSSLPSRSKWQGKMLRLKNDAQRVDHANNLCL